MKEGKRQDCEVAVSSVRNNEIIEDCGNKKEITSGRMKVKEVRRGAG